MITSVVSANDVLTVYLEGHGSEIGKDIAFGMVVAAGILGLAIIIAVYILSESGRTR